MISLFSENYSLTIDENMDTKLPHAKARIIRQATLDGDPGVVMVHRGTYHGDRTFRIRGRVTREQEATLRLMHENETEVHCAIDEGLFLGAISSMTIEVSVLDLEYYVKEKIS